MPFGLLKYGFSKKHPAPRHFAAPSELKPHYDAVAWGYGGVASRKGVETDSAAAGYIWMCLLDAMAEWGGAAVGLTALRGLGS